jgi:hypothetical protein
MELLKPPDPAVGAQKMTTVEMPSGDEGGFIKATFPTGGVRNLGAFDPSLRQNQIARFHIPGQRDEYVRPIARAAAPAPQAFPPPGIQDAPGWAETPIPRSQQMRSARLFREREADARAQRGIQAAAEAAELARLEDLRQDPRGIKADAAARQAEFEDWQRREDYRIGQRGKAQEATDEETRTIVQGYRESLSDIDRRLASMTEEDRASEAGMRLQSERDSILAEANEEMALRGYRGNFFGEGFV